MGSAPAPSRSEWSACGLRAPHLRSAGGGLAARDPSRDPGPGGSVARGGPADRAGTRRRVATRRRSHRRLRPPEIGAWRSAAAVGRSTPSTRGREPGADRRRRRPGRRPEALAGMVRPRPAVRVGAAGRGARRSVDRAPMPSVSARPSGPPRAPPRPTTGRAAAGRRRPRDRARDVPTWTFRARMVHRPPGACRPGDSRSARRHHRPAVPGSSAVRVPGRSRRSDRIRLAGWAASPAALVAGLSPDSPRRAPSGDARRARPAVIALIGGLMRPAWPRGGRPAGGTRAGRSADEGRSPGWADGRSTRRPRTTPAQRAGDAAEELVATRSASAGWTSGPQRPRGAARRSTSSRVDPGPPPALVIVEVRWRAVAGSACPRRPSTIASGDAFGPRATACSTAASCRTGDRPALPLRRPGGRGTGCAGGRPRIATTGARVLTRGAREAGPGAAGVVERVAVGIAARGWSGAGVGGDGACERGGNSAGRAAPRLRLRGRPLQGRQVERVERRVVGHDRDQLALEQVVGLGRRRRVREQVEVQLVAGERPLEGQERAPVERGQAQRADRVAVVARRVALVVLPAVARVARREACPSSGRGRPSRRPTRRRSSRPWRRRRRCSCTGRPAPRTRRSGCRRPGRARGRRPGRSPGASRGAWRGRC